MLNKKAQEQVSKKLNNTLQLHISNTTADLDEELHNYMLNCNINEDSGENHVILARAVLLGRKLRPIIDKIDRIIGASK
jgi:hypothetical protein